MRKLGFLTALVISSAVLLGAATAGADGQNTGGTTTAGGAKVVVVVPGSSSGGYVSTGYHGGGGAASSIQCRFFAPSVAVGTVLPGVGAVITDTSGLEKGATVWLVCQDTGTGEITFENIFQWDPAAPPVLTPSAAVLAQMAANGMVVPKPGVKTWPTTGARGLVNLPVWLYVDNWSTVSASASAGGLTATVEAVPVRAQWNMDDGSVSCTDAGSAYDAQTRPDPSSSTCSFTYQHSSGGRADLSFHNSVVVVWHLHWTATNGQGGDLGDMTSPPSLFTMQIEESQALVAPGRN